MGELGSSKVETEAGTYTVRFIADEFPERPADEGFILATSGRERYAADERIDIEYGDVPDVVLSVLKMHANRDDYWDWEYRSGAALIRYLRLKGYQGVTLVDRDYSPTEATTDRFKRVRGVAIAPEDVPADRADLYVANQLKEWRAWAEGDVFETLIEGPDGQPVEGDIHRGYYGWTEPEVEAYAMDDAREVIDADVAERIEAANRAGAGFVGVI